MPFKLSDAIWLAREVERVKAVLSVQLQHGRGYSAEELLALLKDLGLDYSNPEYVPIGQKLLQEGFLVSIP